MSMVRAWTPYILVGLFLVISRQEFLPFREWLQAWVVGPENIFGSEISSTFQPLFSPGSIFILVTLITFFIHGMSTSAYKRAWATSGKTTLAASVALIFTVPMVQVFLNSGGGTAGYDGMPIVLANAVAAISGDYWPLFATFIGGLGAFIAGSNTVSNMMFSLFQHDVGSQMGVTASWIVALQAVGGAAGNMIAVHNVVAASAVVGLVGKEGMIIRKTVFPFLYYVTVTGALGYSIVWYGEKGLFNLGTFIVLGIFLSAFYIISSNRKRVDIIQKNTTVGFK